MAIIWPKNPKIEDVVAAVTSLEARVAKAETDIIAMRTERTALLAGLNNRLSGLEGLSSEAFGQVAQNVKAIRSVLTILHPHEGDGWTEAGSPTGPTTHALIHRWLDIYGGRVDVEEPAAT